MRFGIDLDGVIANFTGRIIEITNSIWPGRLRPDFVPDNWDYVGTFTKEEWNEVWARVKATPFFWQGAGSLPGMEDLQNFLLQRSGEYAGKVIPSYSLGGRGTRDEIYFITARLATVGESPLVQSSNWLATYGCWPRDGYSTVIPVAEAKHKKQLFEGLGLKLMLDDYAPTVAELNEIEGMHAYVLDQPWNRYATELPRVYSVAEYLDTIKKL